MKAFILAAGRGERMRPLTDTTPKPLLEVVGKPLILHLIEQLETAGIRELVINHSHLGGKIEAALGDGRRFGVRIQYSPEENHPLETGGGIYRALPLLGNGPFLAVNGDIWSEYPFRRLPSNPEGFAHLVLVDNPDHHPAGDFGLAGRRVSVGEKDRLTFSGIGVYRPELFAGCRGGTFRLAPLLRTHIGRGQVTGERYSGPWFDVGAPERLERLSAFIQGQTRG